jgi:5'-3' exonuclease
LPGVKGVGEKLAASLIGRYGSIEAVVEAAEGSAPGVVIGKVRRDLDYVKRAARVVKIPTDLPLDAIDTARPRTAPDPSVVERADRFGLGGAVRRLSDALIAP